MFSQNFRDEGAIEIPTRESTLKKSSIVIMFCLAESIHGIITFLIDTWEE